MKIITVLLALILSGTASADISQEMDFLCEHFSDLSGEIMTSRQQGMKMSDAINIVKSSTEDEVFIRTANKIIIAAYKVPIYNVESNQHMAILEFQNGIYSQCIEEFMK